MTGSSSAIQNAITVANRAGVHVDNTVYEALVAADCTLRSDEKELGVCLADVGAGSTDLLVYHEGMAAHSGVVPVGGDHFTNDVAVGLRTPLVEAEKIKKAFGHTVSSKVPESNEIEVPAVGDRPSRLMPQRFLAEILEPRATELCELLRDHLQHAGVLDLCGAGVVLTGGGSRLSLEHAGRLIFASLSLPTRLLRFPVLPALAAARAWDRASGQRTAEKLERLQEDRVVDNSAILELLAIEPRPFEVGLLDLVGRLRAAGHLR